MVRETSLAPSDLIWPLFVIDGHNERTAIKTMPGVERLSVDLAVAAAKDAAAAGVPALALFPNTPDQLRNEDATEAYNPDNLMCRVLSAIKSAVPEIGLIADVALDDHGYDSVQIMAYTAKYASCFYGPFREAVGSGARLKGDKRTYQMDYFNVDEAMREVEQDIDEGADSVMVKPGLPYLDVIRAVKDGFNVPVFAYQVSGEYAMIEFAAQNGAFDRKAAMLESLAAFKRAGANGVLTYYALEAARLLG